MVGQIEKKTRQELQNKEDIMFSNFIFNCVGQQKRDLSIKKFKIDIFFYTDTAVKRTVEQGVYKHYGIQ